MLIQEFISQMVAVGLRTLNACMIRGLLYSSNARAMEPLTIKLQL